MKLAVDLTARPIPDTFSSLTLLDGSGNPTTTTYEFTSTGIAWPGEKKKYASAPGYASLSDIVPPPNWRARWPDGYTEQNPPPDLRSDEHFQNWMRTAGLPTFSKLYGRNDSSTLPKGTYQMVVDMSEFIECSAYWAWH